MLTPPRQRCKPQAGVTLIELLVAMIIMVVLSTMLVGGWISLQRSFAFASATNKARATARDAIDRVSSEIRAAQPYPLPTPTSSPNTPVKYAPSTPFYFGGTSPYVCDAYHCVFYSAYNNSAAADGTGGAAAQLRLTAIWLDTIVAGAQKTLYWQRDTNGNNTLDSGDRKVVLASNVVNSSLSTPIPIFTYFFRDASLAYTHTNSLTSAGLPSWTTLVSVQVEIVVDANLSHTPTYVDLRTTLQPRNQGAGTGP